MILLELENVHISYGRSHIIFGISFSVMSGNVTSLLGRNGVGKTTTIRGIIGITPPFSGTIRFKGEDITGRLPFVISRTGIGYVPEDKRIFRSLRVWENLKLGKMNKQTTLGDWSMERIYALFPILKERSNYWGTQLSGGEQQMLAIARALMGNPKLLLLDEPSQGLAPILQRRLAGTIKTLREEGITVLLAEQSLRLASEVSDRVHVLEKGVLRFEGTIDELNANEGIKREYLAV
jgi:branched-chain amino acid transport system ATP-binding protein